MAAHVDSASVVTAVSTGVQIFNLVWPVITAILAYITGHWFTTLPAKPPKIEDLNKK